MSQIKKLNVFILSTLLLIGCNPEDNVPQKTFLNVADEEIIYLGEVEDKNALNIAVENDTVRCYVRTIFVMKDDSIETVTAFTIEDYLYITIKTSPYDNPEWYDVDKLTESHEIKFNILDLGKGTYKLRLGVNNVLKMEDDFIID